jgi:hypothetical protein
MIILIQVEYSYAHFPVHTPTQSKDGDGGQRRQTLQTGRRRYEILTLLLHCCYTVVTMVLHCCYTVVTLCYTVVTVLLHCCYTAVTLLLHCSHTVVPLLFHRCGVPCARLR